MVRPRGRFVPERSPPRRPDEMSCRDVRDDSFASPLRARSLFTVRAAISLAFPVEAIFPEDALPQKWEPFVKINYAYDQGADVINKLVDEYATEHDVQNPPLE